MPVVLWDKIREEMFYTSNLKDVDKNRYEPIGVIVIPTEHDVYGTGECGVMALISASLTTPDTGQTSNERVYWGHNNKDFPNLTNFNGVIRMGTMNNNISDNIDGLSSSGYIPLMKKNMSSKFECPHDTKAKYEIYYYSDYGYIPSPYLNDDSRNPDYYTTDPPSSAYNVLSDFAGKSNTEFLCSNATSQPDWKTDETIDNYYSVYYHPAACCCWRFHTPGTNQGDWYLPAMGELGYIAPRYDWINQTISVLQTYFGKTFNPLTTTLSYVSSSEYNSQYVYGINSSNIGYKSKKSLLMVRPFTKCKPKPLS